MPKKGKIFVISSPSGGGKTTVCKKLRRDRFDIAYSVSATTRKPRPGERDGKDYIFLSEREFNRRIANKEFLEYTNNFGDMYGTPRRFVENTIKRGGDIILSIDVKGAMQVKRKIKGSVTVFILPPSFTLLEKRLRGRKTEDRRTMVRRLKVARRELSYLPRYDYMITNDNLANAVSALKAIVIAERSRVEKQ